jgi:acyl-homoserine-lactone acylase
MLRRTLLLALLVCAAFAPAAGARYRVTVRYTAHGIPHITAGDWASLGYGYGRSLAGANLCVLADTYATVSAERSRDFGPDGTYVIGGNGTTNNNLNSDFFWKRIIDRHVVEGLVNAPPPDGPLPALKRAVTGYTAGYNDALKANPDARCAGQPFVHPIDEMTVYRRVYQLTLLASSGVAVDGIGGAQPAADPAAALAAQQRAMGGLKPDQFDDLLGGIGSNAVALGSAKTADHRGLLLGNPHFPWTGSERFYEAQLTIPGKVDVAGASLLGVPAINIGFTHHLAWSHTVSTARRFTGFELRLVPGSPTTYLVDGQPHQMRPTTVTVMAKTASGALEPRTRTLYDTEYGPVLTSILGLPIFPWTPTTAYALGDANAGSVFGRLLNHFLLVDRAQSVPQLQQILKRYEGIPWVNTIAADDAGHAYYADIGNVPNVPNSKIQSCSSPLGTALDAAERVQVLDGSRSACNWDNDPGAAAKGVFGPSHLPELLRDDYVTNSNDSYWLSNPLHPLEGFARIIGDERTARTPRTRLGLRIVADGGDRWTPRQLMDAVFNDRQYLGELWRDDLVAMCRANPTLIGTTGPVDVSPACPVLASWDLHDDLDSRGAVLFRRFATRALGAARGPWATPFDAADPVNTPNGLNTSDPQVQAALADAVSDLKGAGIPLDAPLGDWQYVVRNGRRIPIHGGPGTDGVFNAMNVVWDPKRGYPDVPHGSSYVQVVRVGGGRFRCPDAHAILTYSQSTDPASPFYADQTAMYSRRQWVRWPFCARDIARATVRVARYDR